jgi:hypothetical protein
MARPRLGRARPRDSRRQTLGRCRLMQKTSLCLRFSQLSPQALALIWTELRVGTVALNVRGALPVRTRRRRLSAYPPRR